jgi:NAD+ synthase (glutamine-hydrolysing)
MMQGSFDSIYSHGFVRVAVGIPSVKVADPVYNAVQTIELARRASEIGAAVLLFPELGLSAYTNDDLFQQDALLDATMAALDSVVQSSASLTSVLIVGAPLRFEGKLFNCGVVIYRGRILGVTPKVYLPNYREFYEKRQFAAARDAMAREVTILGERVPFGDVIFEASNLKHFAIHVEICEDVWTAIPPSSYGALAGATILANLSASNITIGKASYRRDLCASQSGRCVAGYLYSAAGPGESTTDLAWDGHALIYENNELLAESERFAVGEQIIAADLDLERLVQDRMRLTSFQDSANDVKERLRAFRRVAFDFETPAGVVDLRRSVERFPFVPSDPARRDENCYEAYNIQVHGLIKRLRSTGLRKVVIGVSGGLDSTQALIVAARAMDRMELGRKNVLPYTMPGFATSETTLKNARALMQSLGVTAHEIDIKPSCLQMLRDIGHPFAGGEPVYDIAFENVQAGDRTSHLFRLANLNDAIVLGTGDLSELALGWCTYGVGDHMSHYNVNASLPKTLIQHLLRWIIATKQFDAKTSSTLQSIVNTEISPELIPADAAGGRDKPAQSTQETIGPYELQDFNLYYISRYGFRPSKVAFLSHHAWADTSAGSWPDTLAPAGRNAYDLATIKRWLHVFLFRFFQTSQFKRSCVPNGPKVGSGGSLSPRGDWRAPSDSGATVWVDELDKNVP